MKPIALSSRRAAARMLRVTMFWLVAAGVSACGGGGGESVATPVAVFGPAASGVSTGAAPFAPLAITWPPVSAPARVFDYDSRQMSPADDPTRATRFILYDDGTFERQLFYLYAGGIGIDGGRYVQYQGVIHFAWDEAFGPYSASTAILDGASLTVQYNDSMHQVGYEDAIYVQTP